MRDPRELVIGPSALSGFDPQALEAVVDRLREALDGLDGDASSWDPPADSTEGGLLRCAGLEASVHGIGGGLSASFTRTVRDGTASSTLVDVLDRRLAFDPAADQADALRAALADWIADLRSSTTTSDADVRAVRSSLKRGHARALVCFEAAGARVEDAALRIVHPTATTPAQVRLVDAGGRIYALDPATAAFVSDLLPAVVDAAVEHGPTRVRFSPWATTVAPLRALGPVEAMRTVRELGLASPPALVQDAGIHGT